MGIVNPFANDEDWTESGGNVYRESGKVGIGTAAPGHTLQVDAGSGFEAGQFNGAQNQYTASFRADTTTGQSYGPYIRGGSNSSDKAFVIDNGLGTLNYFTILGDGAATFTGNLDAESLTVDNITIDADDIILSTGSMNLQAQTAMYIISVDQSIVLDTKSKVFIKKSGTTEFDIGAGVFEFSNNQNSSLVLEETAHNVVGKDLTLSGGSTTAGTTDNIAGGDVIISGGQGKGTGNGGAIYLKTAPASTSGSTLNSLASAMTIKEGRVGIGTEVPNSGALLELSSTTQALILPRMNTTNRDAIAGENGMLIYNTSTNKLNAFCNGSWEQVTSA